MNAVTGDRVTVNGNRGSVVRVINTTRENGKVQEAFTEVKFDNGRHTVYANVEVHKDKG